MNGNMILIGIDECGDEIVIDTYALSLGLDNDELTIWQERKKEKARQEFPEYRYFYFEDRRDWGYRVRLVNPFEDVFWG